jgi:hypothetical protein
MIVEIDERNFGPRRFDRGHPVKGQWVFGGVVCNPGITFFVPVPDRTAKTCTAVVAAYVRGEVQG